MASVNDFFSRICCVKLITWHMYTLLNMLVLWTALKHIFCFFFNYYESKMSIIGCYRLQFTCLVSFWISTTMSSRWMCKLPVFAIYPWRLAHNLWLEVVATWMLHRYKWHQKNKWKNATLHRRWWCQQRAQKQLVSMPFNCRRMTNKHTYTDKNGIRMRRFSWICWGYSALRREIDYFLIFRVVLLVLNEASNTKSLTSIEINRFLTHF